MEPTTVYAAWFSPTGTSKRIAEAVARSLANDRTFRMLDATHAAPEPPALGPDTPVVLAAPVYGGRIAPVALERLEALRGNGTPAIVVAVYGNRAFDGAVAQLARFTAERGFVPVAAAAFVGEHSYSTAATPIAAQRPDARDLGEAAEFGAAVRRKLAADKIVPVDASRLRTPRTPLWSLLRFAAFVVRLRRRQKRNPTVNVPAGEAGRCTRCGRCAALCPVEAIPNGEFLHTDPARCIRCNACVRGCPFGARTYPTPFAAALARNFARRKPPVTLL